MEITYDQAKQYFLSGYSLSRIAKEFNFDRHVLAKKLKFDGITIVKNNPKYTHIENYFSCIDTPEKAYWLGFLFADGYIQSNGKRHILELSLQERDSSHLFKLAGVLSPKNVPTERITTLNGKQFKSHRLTIVNKQIVSDLISHGCVNKKSAVITYPNILHSLDKDFIRGYVDGDGSLGCYNGKYYFSVCSGSKEFVESIQQKLLSCIDTYTEVAVRKDSRSNLWSFQKGGGESVHKIIEYLYKDAPVYLDRKYQYLLSLPSKKETS